jgi:hypothetical protein
MKSDIYVQHARSANVLLDKKDEKGKRKKGKL